MRSSLCCAVRSCRPSREGLKMREKDREGDPCSTRRRRHMTVLPFHGPSECSPQTTHRLPVAESSPRGKCLCFFNSGKRRAEREGRRKGRRGGTSARLRPLEVRRAARYQRTASSSLLDDKRSTFLFWPVGHADSQHMSPSDPVANAHLSPSSTSMRMDWPCWKGGHFSLQEWRNPKLREVARGRRKKRKRASLMRRTTCCS